MLHFVGYLDLPIQSGKLKDISKMDAEFFGLESKVAEIMDPQIRMLHEVVYETIWDAGLYLILNLNCNDLITLFAAL